MKASASERPARAGTRALRASKAGRDWTRLVPIVLAGLAVFGLGISTYLAVTHYADKPIACGGLGECDYVNASQYASVGGIPVSVLGMLMYSGLLGAAVAWALRSASDFWPVAYWAMALAGVGYAGYLTYVELEILHAICVWCVVSAVVLVTSLALSTAYLLLSD